MRLPHLPTMTPGGNLRIGKGDNMLPLWIIILIIVVVVLLGIYLIRRM
jgi:hypothetical protein